MPSAKQLKPFNTEDINILLLENVNQTGVELLENQGYQVTFLKSALSEDELIEKIRCGNAKCFLRDRPYFTNILVQGCPRYRNTLEDKAHG